MRTRRLACVALLLLLAVACDRRLEPWVEASAEPPPPERPVRIPGLEAPVARSGPVVQPRPSAAAAAATAGPGIRGVLELAPGTRAPGGVLFLIARTAAAGPPLAVKRLPAGPFPMAFEIGPGDVMLPGLRFAGEIRLSARIDSDGDPLTRSEADLTAELSTPVRPGASDIVLTLAGGG